MAETSDQANKISRRALVVDDSPIDRKLHAKILHKLGFDEVDTAENGAMAVDRFKAGNKHDLVLMDFEMPVMDGPNATMKLREMGVKCKIIGVTSLVASGRDEEMRNEFVKAGIDGVYGKPLQQDEIKNVVEEILKNLMKDC